MFVFFPVVVPNSVLTEGIEFHAVLAQPSALCFSDSLFALLPFSCLLSS